MEIGKVTVSGYETLEVEELALSAALNDHGRMRLNCIIKKEDAQTYMGYGADGHEVSIYAGDRVLFCGNTVRVRCIAEKEFTRMELYAETADSLLDREKKTRSFQDTGMQLLTLVRTALLDSGAVPCLFHGENAAIGKLIVQYQETDWEFLKRVASMSHDIIFSRMDRGGTHLIWGLDPDEKIKDIHVTDAGVEKDLSLYRRKKNAGLTELLEDDAVVYELASDSFLLPGDAISYDGRKLYIRDASCHMGRADFQAVYHAGTKNGLKQPELYCDGMAGAALEGTILAVAGEKIRAHLSVDQKQDPQKAYWFPFSAMTAASDGSGWYYMPEIGDCVKICLPDRDAGNAFAVSAVSGYDASDGGEDRMGNPDVKYMRNPSGKNLALSPEGIKADSSGGKAAMRLNQSGSIQLSGHELVDLFSEGDIEIISGKEIEIEADKQIDIKSDQSGELLLDESGEIRELGGQVNLNMEE